MWLIKIDKETGLIQEDPSNDGWRGISAFMEMYKKYGIEGMTVIALSADYLSPFRNYREKDRPGRVMEEIYGVRNFINFQEDKVASNAYAKYRELQFQSDMQMNGLNMEIKHDLIEKLTKAFEEGNDPDIDKLNKRLSKFNETESLFNKNFDAEKIIDKHSIAANGYRLTRIEIDIEARRNSKFVNSDQGFENPNKLGLESDGELSKTKVIGVVGEVKEKRTKRKTTKRKKS